MILPAPEWNWLSDDAQNSFLNNEFIISRLSDRMGFRLDGTKIFRSKKEELVSSAVTFGTIQLLPDGSVVLLMADHQTTGGYPRIASVITAHHSAIAQKKPGDSIKFELTDISTAEKLFFEQENILEELRNNSIEFEKNN
jgi:antagonist of KipI